MRLEVDYLESSLVELQLKLAVDRVLYSVYEASVTTASQEVCLGGP